MANWMEHDFAVVFEPVFGKVETDVTAGGSGDATEVDGAYIDVTDCESVVAVISGTTTLQEDETLAISANFQDATAIGGTGVADFGTALAATVVATGGTGGTTETFAVKLSCDVSQSRGYVRLQFTPNASASGTDTAKVQMVYVRGGKNRRPVGTTYSLT